MSPVYFRFVVGALDSDSRRRAGIFRLLDHVKRRSLAPRVARRVRSEFDWMCVNLPVARLRPCDPEAIFWFRPGAGEPLRRMRALATWLRANGVHVDNLATRAPGRIVYRDRFQIAAVPTYVRPERWDTVGDVTVDGHRSRLLQTRWVNVRRRRAHGPAVVAGPASDVQSTRATRCFR